MPSTLDFTNSQDIEEGMFLPGIDNGYVIDVEESPYYVDENGMNPFRGMTMITFNTADGDEGYLILPDDVPIKTVKGE